jgi:hypothetical protein
MLGTILLIILVLLLIGALPRWGYSGGWRDWARARYRHHSLADRLHLATPAHPDRECFRLSGCFKSGGVTI